MFASLLASGSYVAIVAVLLLTGLGLPLPEEVAVIAAGMAAAAGQLDPWLAAGCCIVGILLGDGYSTWRADASAATCHAVAWWTRMVTPERELKMERLILRHGLKVLFFGRFLIGLRAPIYLTAGVLHMPPRRFLLIDTISTVVVAGSFFLLSFVYGAPWGTGSAGPRSSPPWPWSRPLPSRVLHPLRAARRRPRRPCRGPMQPSLAAPRPPDGPAVSPLGGKQCRAEFRPGASNWLIWPS